MRLLGMKWEYTISRLKQNEFQALAGKCGTAQKTKSIVSAGKVMTSVSGRQKGFFQIDYFEKE